MALMRFDRATLVFAHSHSLLLPPHFCSNVLIFPYSPLPPLHSLYSVMLLPLVLQLRTPACLPNPHRPFSKTCNQLPCVPISALRLCVLPICYDTCASADAECCAMTRTQSWRYLVVTKLDSGTRGHSSVKYKVWTYYKSYWDKENCNLKPKPTIYQRSSWQNGF